MNGLVIIWSHNKRSRYLTSADLFFFLLFLRKKKAFLSSETISVSRILKSAELSSKHFHETTKPYWVQLSKFSAASAWGGVHNLRLGPRKLSQWTRSCGCDGVSCRVVQVSSGFLLILSTVSLPPVLRRRHYSNHRGMWLQSINTLFKPKQKTKTKPKNDMWWWCGFWRRHWLPFSQPYFAVV